MASQPNCRSTTRRAARAWRAPSPGGQGLPDRVGQGAGIRGADAQPGGIVQFLDEPGGRGDERGAQRHRFQQGERPGLIVGRIDEQVGGPVRLDDLRMREETAEVDTAGQAQGLRMRTQVFFQRPLPYQVEGHLRRQHGHRVEEPKQALAPSETADEQEAGTVAHAPVKREAGEIDAVAHHVDTPGRDPVALDDLVLHASCDRNDPLGAREPGMLHRARDEARLGADQARAQGALGEGFGIRIERAMAGDDHPGIGVEQRHQWQMDMEQVDRAQTFQQILQQRPGRLVVEGTQRAVRPVMDPHALQQLGAYLAERVALGQDLDLMVAGVQALGRLEDMAPDALAGRQDVVGDDSDPHDGRLRAKSLCQKKSWPLNGASSWAGRRAPIMPAR
ncbi:MAG TPA: hypothetical protein VHL31_25185 [Geminicoccus sp.]|jgi:hypothetical protein|nr:hypothetical protein [Geminicoccus sp.]HEX2529575.1 hypothetical protein [Geminicoccus sp.]